MSDKLPYFEFYIGDWTKNANLRRCNFAAQGVWAGTLCLMAECDERGVLITNQKSWTLEETAMALGGNYDVALRCLNELHQKSVMKHREKDGAYYCDWMVHYEHIRQVRKEAGFAGAKARLLKQTGNHQSNGKKFCLSKASTKRQQNTEDEDGNEDEGKMVGRDRVREREKQAQEIYAAYPLKAGKPDALKAIAKQLTKHEFTFLLKQTRSFAEARGGDLDYCPWPQKWFNQERFNDDPTTWTRQQTNGAKQPATSTRENIKCKVTTLEEQ